MIEIDENLQFDSIKILPILGYLILGLVLLNYIIFLYPLNFLNPYWELEMIGNIVETFLAPLLGFILVFIPRDVSLKEKLFLKWLSRLIIVMGICLILLLPLLFFNFQRINKNNWNAYNAQQSQQNQQFTQIEKNINQASKQQLETLLRQNIPKNQEIPKIDSKKELELYFSAILNNNKQNVTAINKTNLQKTSLELKKTVLKRGLGLIICATLIFYISQYSRWARLN